MVTTSALDARRGAVTSVRHECPTEAGPDNARRWSAGTLSGYVWGAMLDSRAHLLRAAGGFCRVPPNEPEMRLLHRSLDSWRGVGDVVVGAVS